MTTFQEHKPNINDRLNWVKKGFKVFCCDCWWIGREIDYDSCPDCKSDKLEWILETEDNYEIIMGMLQNVDQY